MRILVTGALGHIGSNFIRSSRMSSSEVEFVLVDNMSTQRFCSLFNLDSARYTMIEGGVLEVVTPDLVASASAVVHLAAIADPGLSMISSDEVYQHNLGNTRHVVKACLAAGVPLVFPSSTSVYGGHSLAITESSETLRPHTPYAMCKLAEEELIKEAFASGLSGAILRFGTVFGTSPGMRFHTAVNRFCWQASLGLPLSVFRTAMNQVRPYLGVQDASNALAHTVLGAVYQPVPLNVASCNMTVAEILHELRRVVPDLVVQEIDSPVMNQDSYGVSTVLASELGYTFESDLASGVGETMELLNGIRRP